VLGGDSVVEDSAVCYKGYENGRPENVSSGGQYFNKPKNRRAPYSHLYRPELFNRRRTWYFV